MNKDKIKTFYTDQLENDFLPYWEQFIDEDYGGVFTCVTNKGDEKISDKKYIWSQGRFLWLCSKLLKMRHRQLVKLLPVWEEAANQTYEFLINHTVMPNSHIVYAVERDGSQLADQMDTSIFADCFFVLGCNAFASYKQNDEMFNKALVIYEKIKERILTGDFKSDPYPIPKGFHSHSIPMILLNVSEELVATAKQLRHPSEQVLLNDVRVNFDKILLEHNTDERIVEMLPEVEEMNESLLARHVNPGHTLECAWFMQHSLKFVSEELQNPYLEQISKLAKKALLLGWDDRDGGLFRFVDKDGGPPKGENNNSAFESLLVDTWDTKLWWPHSEALYTTLLFSEITNDKFFTGWYEKVATYVFNTFPNEDSSIGEWIQIRNRQGQPLKKVVALPVKDPFHIMRNFILIIMLLSGDEE